MRRVGLLLRGSRVWLAAVVVALLASPTLAQIPAPPVVQHVDSNGVDPVSGSYNTRATDISIGPGGARGLTYERFWVGNGWLSSVIATMSGKGASPAVSVGGTTETFTRTGSTSSGSTYQNDGSSSSTLSRGPAGSDYVYTSANGTIIRFMPSSSATLSQYDSQIAWARSITWPDGTVQTFHYKTGSYSGPAPGGGTYTVLLGRLQAVTNSLGYQLKFTYAANTVSSTNVDAWQWPTRVTAINNGVEYCAPTADSCSLVNAWPHADYTYAAGSAYAHLTSATDASGRTWSYNYAPYTDQLSGVRRPGASSDDVVITYGSNGVSGVQGIGSTWSYGYVDAANAKRTTTITDPASHTRTIVSNYGQVSTETNENGHVTSFQYTGLSSASDLVSKVTLPEGNSVDYVYDSRANVTSTVQHAKVGSGLSDLTTSAGYPTTCASLVTCNKPLWTRDPLGNQTDYTYDATHGGVLTVTAPAPTSGGTRPQSRYTYSAVQAYYKNAAGSIVSSGVPTYVLSQTSTCQTLASCVGSADEVRSTTNYGPQSTSSANNLLPISVSTGSGNGVLTATANIAYDSIGNVVTSTDPLGAVSRFAYDDTRRLVASMAPDPDGAGSRGIVAQHFTYGADGQRTFAELGTLPSQATGWSSFVAQQVVQTYYDGYGRKIRDQLVAGGGNVYNFTQYGYDVLGRLQCTALRMNPAAYGAQPDPCALGTAGPGGPDRITRITYDNADQPTLTQSAYGTAEQVGEGYSYSANGKLRSVTDGQGNLTSYSYDGFDRPVITYFPSPSSPNTINPYDYEQLTYDANSRVTNRRLRDGTSIGYSYDALGRTTLMDMSGSGIDQDITFGYDLFGRMTTSINATGHLTNYAYDALGRVSSETTTYGGTRTFLYDAKGDRKRMTWPDGFYVTYDYDAAGAMTAILENGTTALATFGYDALGRRSSLVRGNGVATSYGYDPASRLTSLGQDLNGTANDLALGFSYNAAGQIASRTSSNDLYAWPGALNVDRSYTVNGLNQYTMSGSVALGYDARGNLTSSGSSTYVYSQRNQLAGFGGTGLYYDPLSRLDLIAGGGANTTLDYDGDRLATEGTYGSSAIARRYVFGPGTDEPLVWYEGSGITDKRWLVADERGSVVAVTDGSGNALSINSYDEYGIPSAINPAYQGRFGYTGQAWLPSLGMYYYKARMYSPTLGRFMQTDPIGYGDGLNWYSYVGGDPVNRLDPSGTCTGSLIDSGCDPGTGLGYGQSGNGTPFSVSGDKSGREAGAGLAPRSGGVSTYLLTHYSDDTTTRQLLYFTPDPSFEVLAGVGSNANSQGELPNTIRVTARLHGPTRIRQIQLTWEGYGHIFSQHAWFPFQNTSRFSPQFRNINSIYGLVGRTIMGTVGLPQKNGNVYYNAVLPFDVGTDENGNLTRAMTVIVRPTDLYEGTVVTAYPGY